MRRNRVLLAIVPPAVGLLGLSWVMLLPAGQLDPATAWKPDSVPLTDASRRSRVELSPGHVSKGRFADPVEEAAAPLPPERDPLEHLQDSAELVRKLQLLGPEQGRDLWQDSRRTADSTTRERLDAAARTLGLHRLPAGPLGEGRRSVQGQGPGGATTGMGGGQSVPGQVVGTQLAGAQVALSPQQAEAIEKQADVQRERTRAQQAQADVLLSAWANEEQRLEAGEQLARAGGLSFLIQATEDYDAVTRRLSATALAQATGPSVHEALTGLTQDADPAVQAAAREALAAMQDSSRHKRRRGRRLAAAQAGQLSH